MSDYKPHTNEELNQYYAEQEKAYEDPETWRMTCGGGYREVVSVNSMDLYFDELERAEEQREIQEYSFAGGYEASNGDWEGASLAKAEYEAGLFS